MQVHASQLGGVVWYAVWFFVTRASSTRGLQGKTLFDV
jgi:hypothetical protein